MLESSLWIYLPGMITDSVLDAYSSVTVDQLIQETKELHSKIENELKHPQTTEEYIISELHLLQYRIAKNQLTWGMDSCIISGVVKADENTS